MQRIGVLGGTFDPIHYGHLAMAEEARLQLALDRVYLVPVAQQPLKDSHYARPQQRFAMVQLACQGNQSLVASDLELRRPPPSYTADTLRALHQQLAAETGSNQQNRTIWFILGADTLASFPRWHQPRQVLEQARLAVVNRPGVSIDWQPLEAALPGMQQQTDMLAELALAISSHQLRQRFASGRAVRYQLPDAVITYIQKQQLYGFPPAAG